MIYIRNPIYVFQDVKDGAFVCVGCVEKGRSYRTPNCITMAEHVEEHLERIPWWRPKAQQRLHDAARELHNYGWEPLQRRAST